MTKKLKIILVSGLLTISSFSAQATMQPNDADGNIIIEQEWINIVFDPNTRLEY